MNKSPFTTQLLIGAVFFAIGMTTVFALKDKNPSREGQEAVAVVVKTARPHDSSHRLMQEDTSDIPRPVENASNIVRPRSELIMNIKSLFTKDDMQLSRMKDALDILGATEDQKKQIRAQLNSTAEEMNLALNSNTKNTEVSLIPGEQQIMHEPAYDANDFIIKKSRLR